MSFLSRLKPTWPWLCSLLSGILLALSYPPADFDGLAWVALTPLLAAVWLSPAWKQREGLRQFLLGYVAGLGYFLGCFAWINTVTTLGWAALCAYLAVYPALWAVFVGQVVRPSPTGWLSSWRNLLAASLAAAAWVTLEWIRQTLFSGFGWDCLGVTLYRKIALIQICDLTGIAGLSFLLVMVNTMIVLTLKRFQTEIAARKARTHYDFSLTVALVVLVLLYGYHEIRQAPPPSEPLTIAAIQANIPIVEKRDPEHEERILDIHIDLTLKALTLRPDLLIWPEAATPEPLLSDRHNWDVVSHLAGEFNGDFMLGTVYFGPEGAFNSAVLLTHHAKEVQIYNKIHLVPFGEYVPLRKSFPVFAWIVGKLVPDDFDFGHDYTVFQMAAKPIKIGPLICFEDTLGELSRQFVLRGAQIFVCVTNDGWFLHSVGSLQHMRQSVFRCAETKIPMVRATNSGVTCVVDRLGRVQQTLTDEKHDTYMQGFFNALVNVPTIAPKTFYTLHGDLLSPACLVASLIAIAAGFRRRRANSSCPPAAETKFSDS